MGPHDECAGLGVDLSFVVDNQTKNLVDMLRTQFREARLRGGEVTLRPRQRGRQA